MPTRCYKGTPRPGTTDRNGAQPKDSLFSLTDFTNLVRCPHGTPAKTVTKCCDIYSSNCCSLQLAQGWKLKECQPSVIPFWVTPFPDLAYQVLPDRVSTLGFLLLQSLFTMHAGENSQSLTAHNVPPRASVHSGAVLSGIPFPSPSRRAPFIPPSPHGSTQAPFSWAILLPSPDFVAATHPGLLQRLEHTSTHALPTLCRMLGWQLPPFQLPVRGRPQHQAHHGAHPWHLINLICTETQTFSETNRA